MSGRDRERESVCEGDRVCVRETMRERGRLCVSVCVSEREREREGGREGGSACSYKQVYKHGITILYHLHQCRLHITRYFVLMLVRVV